MVVKMAIMTHPIRKEHLKVNKFILRYEDGSPYTNYFGYQLMLIADLTIDVDCTKIYDQRVFFEECLFSLF